VTHEPVFEIGERVRKNHGYLWPGVVVAVFETLGGERRVVVECTAPTLLARSTSSTRTSWNASDANAPPLVAKRPG